MSTLRISYGPIITIISGKSENKFYIKSDKRGKHNPIKNLDKEDRDKIKSHIR